MVGILVACVTGQANLAESAPPIANLADLPSGAPPIWPFLFITIACGAVSGFHCLVSSGTSSKQIANEKDAKFVGYGAMLLEGALAVIVILACCAGVGMGKFNLDKESNNYVIAKTAEFYDTYCFIHENLFEIYFLKNIFTVNSSFSRS